MTIFELKMSMQKKKKKKKKNFLLYIDYSTQTVKAVTE